jgi:hypothetical protein
VSVDRSIKHISDVRKISIDVEDRVSSEVEFVDVEELVSVFLFLYDLIWVALDSI